ncbi:lysophospholipase [Desulfonema ishimotonii]|uniref:Lysophospholipase n=1 Tax=Desulfonema ishimotonii TaxID=45657 RepID=A0A401FR90_9BACT|nr:alpha/beta hydrolase [Desulfonema ishimotonii]GBC59474.1 lysophospholipase [Desulfonema ishimotonii]
MAIFTYNDHDIHYEFSGEPDTPVITFINGLTQRTDHWIQYAKNLNKAGYRVLSYDLLGQGTSSKPVLFIDFNENPKILAALLDHLRIQQTYVAGVSFGGIIVLHFGIEYPDRVKGLIPMSCFTEMDGQLRYIGLNLYTGMVNVGFEYLVDLLIPINFSSAWIEKNRENIPLLKRTSFSYNDLYAIQNLIESIRDFRPFTKELGKIACPTLILNGEYDCLTPRWAHEVMRLNISNSRLMIMQKVCHAFTIEIPDITCRVIADFADQVETGRWGGDKSVWIAADDPASEEIAFPCQGNHTRAVPFMKKY